MLAGVDYLLMGAGIPKDIPSVMEKFVTNSQAELKLDLPGGAEVLKFDPSFMGIKAKLRLPKFLPIVSSPILATMLKRKAGKIDGFVVENNLAGGHNAPERKNSKSEESEFEEYRKLDLPFWYAGGVRNPEDLERAISNGATGVQIGSLFALSNESGIDPEIKRVALNLIRKDQAQIYTDHLASPTGFPFKVFPISNSISDDLVYKNRIRKCDLGYLRTAYRQEDGNIGFRCPGEPVETYVKKGGKLGDTEQKKCLCNSLFSVIGQAQTQKAGKEPALLTAGEDLSIIKSILKDRDNYNVSDVINFLIPSTIIINH
jgi:NAD(P)H-dependent flavin oxidoreductase YrpB (nitropropane dioxygenase family)